MLAIQVTSKEIPISPSISALIEKYSNILTRFNKQIFNCRIVIGQCQKHKHQGKLFEARIEALVPKKELAVTRKRHEDLYVAVRDADQRHRFVVSKKIK